MFPTPAHPAIRGTLRIISSDQFCVGVFIVAFQRKKPAVIGTKAPFPGFIEPALATSIDNVPSGDRWIHEIKFDGYRVQVHLVNEAVKVFTRRGHDWTKRFRKVADDAWHIGAGSVIIDGEIVVPAAGARVTRRDRAPSEVWGGKSPPSLF
jgi:ATP-dependent DNA ligase